MGLRCLPHSLPCKSNATCQAHTSELQSTGWLPCVFFLWPINLTTDLQILKTSSFKWRQVFVNEDQIAGNTHVFWCGTKRKKYPEVSPVSWLQPPFSEDLCIKSSMMTRGVTHRKWWFLMLIEQDSKEILSSLLHKWVWLFFALIKYNLWIK